MELTTFRGRPQTQLASYLLEQTHPTLATMSNSCDEMDQFMDDFLNGKYLPDVSETSSPSEVSSKEATPAAAAGIVVVATKLALLHKIRGLCFVAVSQTTEGN